ncbi:OmpA domain protein transmembrane region-containing protein [Parvibaculum lavamentivorans DS-1]|uniref:OmpA domain protein transmembrane region-containing protein n=2 Tax=Parvibaculum lavamentivorans TaxID=256618 RepID=A7HTS0_PARL1|nr:OmpA domain protein transmembrane region-containing protein [Parvibaculum lavamentivorans DS-1]
MIEALNKMKTALRTICAAGVALGLAGFASAASAQETETRGNIYNQTHFQPGLYVGGGLGWGWSDDDDDWTWKGIAGWRLNQYLAVQGFYADLTDITVAGVSSDVDTFGAELLASFPVSDTMAIYGKGGLHNYDEVGSGRDTSWLAGAGVDFALSDNMSLRTEWTHYDLDSDDVDEASVQIVFGF